MVNGVIDGFFLLEAKVQKKLENEFFFDCWLLIGGFLAKPKSFRLSFMDCRLLVSLRDSIVIRMNQNCCWVSVFCS